MVSTGQKIEHQTTPMVERLGRVALSTQGILYVVIGLLAMQVAYGDSSAKPSQRGAIESVARQPFGVVLLVLLIIGMAAYACWRLALAARGEPGEGDDGKSVVKRIANVGRAAVYGGLILAAVRILMDASEGGGDTQRKSTARVLDWPMGETLVVLVGLAVIGAGVWNMSKMVTAKFLEHLDLAELDERQSKAVELIGRAGYFARGVAFALVGWFLVAAGLHHNANESRGLDASLRELTRTSKGPVLLLVLAIGMMLFGVFRIIDGQFRKLSEIAYS
ncbi:MAG: DUF1206 domain-containing protein [Aquihabitans sp.]